MKYNFKSTRLNNTCFLKNSNVCIEGFNKKGGFHMAVSKAVVPLLRDECSIKLMQGFQSAKMKPYSEEKREKTLNEISKLLAKRQR